MRRIAPEIIVEVKRLLRETTLSSRAIARRTKVSRGTVLRAKWGKRWATSTPPPHVTSRVIVPKMRPLKGPVKRCPGCGGKAIILEDAGVCWACYLSKGKP